MRVLITGAAGRVGTIVTGALAHHDLRLSDIRPPNSPDERWWIGDLDDPDFVASLVSGVDTLVHLSVAVGPGSNSRRCMDEYARAVSTIDAAVAAGVSRVIFASSVHVYGRYNRPATRPVRPQWPAAPCCEYGIMKLAIEEHLALLTHRAGLSAIALRLGLTGLGRGAPDDAGLMLSDSDAAALFETALSAPLQGLHRCFATSANSAAHWDLDAARQLGYRPRTDSASLTPTMDSSQHRGCVLKGEASLSNYETEPVYE